MPSDLEAMVIMLGNNYRKNEYESHQFDRLVKADLESNEIHQNVNLV